ncbi:MAG: YihY/virulence factor BrkB family protein [Actinomycetota bacterium]
MTIKTIFSLLKETFKEWQEDKAPTLAAALAYYTIFSLAPLLIILIAIAGLAFGQEAAQGLLVGQLQSLVGRGGAETIQDLVANASHPQSGIVATLIGIATLLWGASNVFTNLKEALNMIWNATPPPNQGAFNFLRDRLLSFAMILSIGFLLLVSLVVSSVLAALSQWLNGLLHVPVGVWQLIDFGISFSVVTLLFALIYKFLPDIKLDWNDVWIGAAITSVLFTIGKSLIGLYLGNSSIASAYGAAGSFVVVLLWINFSAQILFLGAEFTQVWAKRYGSLTKSQRTTPLNGPETEAPLSQHRKN